MAAVDTKELDKPGAVVVTGTEPTKLEPIKAGGKEYGSVEDLTKAYEAAQTELGKWTQQHGDLKKQYDETLTYAKQWNEWWNRVKPVWGEDVEQFLEKKLGGKGADGTQPQRSGQLQVSAQPQGQVPSTWDGFDLLRPEEQAARIETTLANRLTQAVEGWQQAFDQKYRNDLAQREKWYQTYLANHLSLMRRALEKRIQNPKFDVDKVMERAAQAIGGQIDPIELGQTLLSAADFDARIDEERKASYEQGRKDFEQELANKKLETPPPTVSVPSYRVPTTPPGKTRLGLAGLRERAAEAMAKKHGPGIFSGE